MSQWNPDLAIDLSDYPISIILERSGYVKVPMPSKNSQFEIRATINGKPARFILDTGAQSTTLSREAAERLGIANGKEVGSARGISGVPTKLFSVWVDSFQLNGHDTALDSVYYCEIPGFSHDGLLGFDEIERLHAIIDYSQEAIYIKSPQED